MSTLVECPICRGVGMLSNNADDPQMHDDDTCHGCDGTGNVSRVMHDALLDSMTDEAAAEAERRLREADDDAEHAAQIEKLQRQELADRDREWWW